MDTKKTEIPEGRNELAWFLTENKVNFKPSATDAELRTLAEKFVKGELTEPEGTPVTAPAKIPGALLALPEQLAGLTDIVDQLQKQITALEGDVQGLTDIVDQLQKQITALEGDVQGLTAEVEALKATPATEPPKSSK